MTCALRSALQRMTSDDGVGWSPMYRRALANKVLAILADYPDQMELARDLSASKQNVASFGTRRSGKTLAIALWIVANMLAKDNWTAVILTNTLHAPSENILARKQDGGVAALLHGLGLRRPVCKVSRVGTKQSVVQILFPLWGSSLTVFDIGSVRAIDNKHGFSCDFVWIDELTKTVLAEYALANLVNPVLGDSQAIVAVSYTPDDEVDSLASQIAQGETSYKRHHFRSWRNPFFGPSFVERWQRLVETLVKTRDSYQLSDDDLRALAQLTEQQADDISLGTETEDLAVWVRGLDPELLRNFFGRFTVATEAYVYYPFHRLPNDLLYWYAVDEEAAAQHRLPDGSLLPVARTVEERLWLLPSYPTHGRATGHFHWRVTIGADIGYYPDPFAVVARIWSYECQRVYELYSYKEHRLEDTSMFEHVEWLCTHLLSQRVNGIPLVIDLIVADLTGMRTGTRMEWDRLIRERIPALAQVGVRAPRKPEVLPRIRAHNMDMVAGRHRYGAGGCVAVEGRHLRFKKDKPREIDKHREVKSHGAQKEIPGNDALDTCMYADHLIPVLYSRPPKPPKKQRSAYFGAMDQ